MNSLTDISKLSWILNKISNMFNLFLNAFIAYENIIIFFNTSRKLQPRLYDHPEAEHLPRSGQSAHGQGGHTEERGRGRREAADIESICQWPTSRCPSSTDGRQFNREPTASISAIRFDETRFPNGKQVSPIAVGSRYRIGNSE